MASQKDVELALTSIIANTLYPQGILMPSIFGYDCKIYRGWPTSPVLDDDLKANVSHISVASENNTSKNVTKYPRIWKVIEPSKGTLKVDVLNLLAEFSGSCTSGLLAGVLVNNEIFSYAVQENDNPETVASNLACLIRTKGWIVNYSRNKIEVPESTRFFARVVTGAKALKEVRRQKQDFRVSMWCSSPEIRDELVPIIDVGLSDYTFIALADGSYGRIRFESSELVDQSMDAVLYQYNLIYNIEYPTTLEEKNSAMLFGITKLVGDNVLIETYNS